MGKKKKNNDKQYMKINMTDGFSIDANMKMENIAYVIGHLFVILEENGYGPQEKMATSIVETNRKQAAGKK